MCSSAAQQRRRRLVQPGTGSVQPPKNSVTIMRRRRDHVGVFAHEEQRELHRAVFDVVAAGQFLLGLRQIERRAVRFRKRRDEENEERKNVSGCFEDEPVGRTAALRLVCATTSLRFKSADAAGTAG